MVNLGGRFADVRLPLRTDRLLLRLHRAADAPVLAHIVNDPRVLCGLAIPPGPYSITDELRFVRINRRAALKGDSLPLAITLKADGTLIGVVSLGLNSGAPDVGGLGYWLAPQYWHQGYGTEAVAALCQVAFRTLRLHHLQASVFDSNPRSMALLRRLGFKTEGHRREVRRQGRLWEGETLFGLLRPEFRLARR